MWGQLGSCRLTVEDRKLGTHMCVTDTQRMHRRFGCSHQQTIPVANWGFTFWALWMCVALHPGHMIGPHTARVTHTLVCTGYVFSVTLIYDCAQSYF